MKKVATIGIDPVAVIVSEDGSMAYTADSAPGDIYAVKLPSLQIAWQQHVLGEPFGLLLYGGHLLVSLYGDDAVEELDPATGSILADHATLPQGAGMTVDANGRVVVASASGYLVDLNGQYQKAGAGFSVALVNGHLWTEDYARMQIIRSDDGYTRVLPNPVHPFWLAPGANGTLLIAAEGNNEDSDPGGVYSYDVASETFTLLDEPRDPDQVLQWGPTIYVAAHGSKQVATINGSHVGAWAQGAAAVAIAPDFPLNLLVVAVNSHE